MKVEAVHLDIQTLQADVTESKDAIEKPDGILSLGMVNADLSRRIINSIEDLGQAFSLLHNLSITNATAYSTQLGMMDRLLASVTARGGAIDEESSA